MQNIPTQTNAAGATQPAITQDQYTTAREWILSHGLQTTINTILDCAESGETIYVNEDERFGDGYYYVESELDEMIEGCGWENTTPEDVMTGGVEVPNEVVMLARLKPDGMKWSAFEKEIKWEEDFSEVTL